MRFVSAGTPEPAFLGRLRAAWGVPLRATSCGAPSASRVGPRRPDHHLAVDGIDDSRRQATGPSIVGQGRRQVPGERDGQGRAAGDLDDVLERPAVAVLHVARARRQAEFSAV
jgi:hypothetical protein